jgi:alkanesulfonate monooxygenase SsuD/methylene tetrahydromethanopterin reductase-like flavin-dependent oxidoreductase (luciferase family)
LKFAISTAFTPLDEVCQLAQAADRFGYEMVAVSDHVVHPRTLKSPYPYTADGRPRWEPFTDWSDAWVMIGAMAAVTKRLKFTTSVYVLPMRNPFLVAKSVATAAAVSGGRVTLGIGVGWMEEEFDLLGQSFRRRGKRTN